MAAPAGKAADPEARPAGAAEMVAAGTVKAAEERGVAAKAEGERLLGRAEWQLPWS